MSVTAVDETLSVATVDETLPHPAAGAPETLAEDGEEIEEEEEEEEEEEGDEEELREEGEEEEDMREARGRKGFGHRQSLPYGCSRMVALRLSVCACIYTDTTALPFPPSRTPED